MWKKLLKSIADNIVRGNNPFNDISLEHLKLQYEHFYNQMIMEEENMNCAEADAIWQRLEILQNFIFKLYPEYKDEVEKEKKEKEENIQKAIESGAIKVVHINF